MSKPIVAVVGRPNVGKSTFFNKVVGRRVSIVEDTPGVTRDRIYAEAEWRNRHFALIDTGRYRAFEQGCNTRADERAGADCNGYSRCHSVYGGRKGRVDNG